jgi:hypothetical protein
MLHLSWMKNKNADFELRSFIKDTYRYPRDSMYFITSLYRREIVCIIIGFSVVTNTEGAEFVAPFIPSNTLKPLCRGTFNTKRFIYLARKVKYSDILFHLFTFL